MEYPNRVPKGSDALSSRRVIENPSEIEIAAFEEVKDPSRLPGQLQVVEGV